MTSSEWSALLNHYIAKGYATGVEIPKLAVELRHKLEIIELQPITATPEAMQASLERYRAGLIDSNLATLIEAAETAVNQPTPPFRMKLRFRVPAWLKTLYARMIS